MVHPQVAAALLQRWGAAEGVEKSSIGNSTLVHSAKPTHTIHSKHRPCIRSPTSREDGGESRAVALSSECSIGIAATKSHGFIHKLIVHPIVSQSFLECCAGTCRIARACAQIGIPSESFEIQRNKLESICSGHFWRSFSRRIQEKGISGIWNGITCASFCRARRGNPDYSGWPPPLRDDQEGIYGLKGLSDKDQHRVFLGNQLALVTARMIRVCMKHGVPFFLENPKTSRLWIFPPIKKLVASCSQIVVFDHCQYGGETRKSTQIAIWGCKVEGLDSRCSYKNGVCSQRGRAHTILTGIDHTSKEFRTAAGAAYPFAFCQKFAESFKTHLFWKGKGYAVAGG